MEKTFARRHGRPESFVPVSNARLRIIEREGLLASGYGAMGCCHLNSPAVDEHLDCRRVQPPSTTVVPH